MKTRILAFLMIFTLLSCQSSAQDSAISDVKSTIESYIDAGDTNDVVKLKPHLHSDFRVVLYDNKKSKTSILDKSTYVSFIDTKKFGGYERTANYEDFQFIEKNMATVKVTLTSPGKPTLKNFYSLVKIKNDWLVIQDYVILIP
ncbi:nuclear transport factor 2 family protein [Seonamhaeicola algicola]|uniref:Nuclear transport factor 2 family protein n=1 Tax=Seonamhaeicola algicola TaxID=1719036 RepID=A0A5C7AYE1_9FLAO|nr:nuclear transport factor 2 family protein [Seonamhaeicola algicola]TXE13826.1 nuclear transport factor 2 family protein [Seonamhaeicola algicola]